MQSQTINYRTHLPSLDGYRGIAILMVLFCHYYPYTVGDPLTAITQMGAWGVDLFFVLSGFLITGILLDTAEGPHFFKSFYARRALRLFPVYIAFCVVTIVLALLAGEHPTRWCAPLFLYLSNIVLGRGLPLGIYGHRIGQLWSLAVEEQFYCVWPPLILLLGTRKRVAYACIVGTVGALLFRLFYAADPIGHVGIALLLPSRMDSLLLGGLLAAITRSPRLFAQLTSARLYATGLACLLGLIFLYRRGGGLMGRSMILYGLTVLAIFFAVVVALAILPHTWVSAVGRQKWLRFFGRYSYGIYLWHTIIVVPMEHGMAFLSRNGRVATCAGTLVAITVAVAISVVSFHVLERPFLRMKRLFPYPPHGAVPATEATVPQTSMS